MRYRIKSKLQYTGWLVLTIVVLAGLVSCTNEEDARRRDQEQKEQKAKVAAVEQKIIAIQNELLNTHHARKFNVKDFRELNPKFSLTVSNFFQNNYPGNILFEGLLKDISVQKDKYLVHIDVDKIYVSTSLDIFLVCPKAIVEKISLETPEGHFYRNEVYLVSHITNIKKINLQLEAQGFEDIPASININRSRWARDGNFIAEGTCVDLMLKPSKNIDSKEKAENVPAVEKGRTDEEESLQDQPSLTDLIGSKVIRETQNFLGTINPFSTSVDTKDKKVSPLKKDEQSNFPNEEFLAFRVVEEEYGKEVRIYENTGGKEPLSEVEEKVALDVLNKVIQASGPIKEAIYSLHGNPEDADMGYLNIPSTLNLITLGRDGVFRSSRTHRAILSWTSPGSGRITYPIMELDIRQWAEPRNSRFETGSGLEFKHSYLETAVVGVRKCAEDTLICDETISIN